jgi:hypothetical protein
LRATQCGPTHLRGGAPSAATPREF